MTTSIAWIDDVNLVTVDLNQALLRTLETDLEKPIIKWPIKNKTFSTEIIEQIDDTSIKLRLFEDLPIGEHLILHLGETKIPVYPRAIVRTAWFDQEYAVTVIKLGAVYEQTATTFTIWAPTAVSVKLLLSDHVIELDRKDRGIWKNKVAGDWHKTAYQYDVKVNGKRVIVNDPYAKSMTANSEKSVVIDLEKTNPPQFKETPRPQVNHLQDAIIYELHVRDATIQKESSITNRGKYLGLTERGTKTYGGQSSGLSYIKELGVTHVQLLPINDFARVDEIDASKDYNWGYDPLFFQAPEGSYATSVHDPSVRINETKQMIQAFHKADLSVILDVVYNHVYIIDESTFELIVPGYYFRYHDDGSLSDGTGVGNDFASERLMGRKFILDTIDFWLCEYRVDGFRFDLMGILDIETMHLIHERCQQEGSPIMILGEGWDLNTALPSENRATSHNAAYLPGIRFFNDSFRDSVKGNLFDKGNQGYVNGGGHFSEKIAGLVSGSALEEWGNPFVGNPDQTINFVECHDNFTLWDQLKQTNPDATESVRRRMHQLATGITLLSQGVPFIHAGQEWFRTKNDDGNSYLSGDQINQLDWNARDAEINNIEFVKALIALREKYDVFRLTSQDAIRDRLYVLNIPSPVFGVTLLGDDEDIVIYVNPTPETVRVQLPSSGLWQLAVTNDAEWEDIRGEFTNVRAYEFVVLLKQRD